MVINLFNFFRHSKSPPFHTVIRIQLTSLLYHFSYFAISFQFYGANVNVNVKGRKLTDLCAVVTNFHF